jgi:hypothetical protein
MMLFFEIRQDRVWAEREFYRLNWVGFPEKKSDITTCNSWNACKRIIGIVKARKLGLRIYSQNFYTSNQNQNKGGWSLELSWQVTITSMILHVMHYHDIALNYMVGAQLEGLIRWFILRKRMISSF